MPQTNDDQPKQIILETVDESLLLLGESSRKSIYFHLQNIVNLKKEEIPNDLEAFAQGLEKIFGKGATVIEKSIVKNLCRKLGVEYKEEKESSFVDQINQIIENVNLAAPEP